MELKVVAGLILALPFYLFFAAQFLVPAWALIHWTVGTRLLRRLTGRGRGDAWAKKICFRVECVLALCIVIPVVYFVVARAGGDSGPPTSKYQAKVYGW